MTTKEENNYPMAIAISAGIMGALLVLSIFWVISSFEAENVGMGGMVVNYGTSETGIGDDYTSIEEPSMDENANGKVPDKVTPDQTVTPNNSSQSTNQEIQTQNMENSLAINTKQQKSSTTPTTSTAEKIDKPVVNQNALYKGKKNNGTGQGDGEGGAPGNQGSVNGDPLAPNYGEGGSGNGNTPIPLSKFNNLIAPQDDGQKTGKIVVKIQVNRQGSVVSAQAGARGTTFSDAALYRKCEAAVKNATLDPTEKGPELRTANVVFNFKVK